MFGFHTGLESIGPLGIYVGTIIAIILSITRNPVIGIYFLIPLLPLQTMRYRVHAYPLGANLVDLLLLSVIIGLYLRDEKLFKWTSVNGVLAVYACFTYFSMWLGTLQTGAPAPLWFNEWRLQDWKNYMVIPLIFFVVLRVIKTRKQIMILLVLMCLSVTLMNRAFKNNISDRDFSSFSYSLRTEGTMGYAGVNGLAAFEAQFGVFLLGLGLCLKSWRWKAGFYALMGFCVYCLVYSLSRGGYAGFLAGFLFLALVKSRKLLIGLVVLLLTWQTILPNAVIERIVTTKSEDGEVEASAAARLILWEDALQVANQKIVFGTGFNTYALTTHVGGFGDTHNLYIKVLVETGVIGVAIFLWLMWRIYSVGYQLFRNANDHLLSGLGLGLATWMVTAFVANMFGDRWMYLQITGYLFTILALVVRGHAIVQAEQEEVEAEPENPVAGPATIQTA